MAKNEFPNLKKQQEIGEAIHAEIRTDDVLEPNELKNPQKEIGEINSVIERMLDERRDQRKEMMSFVKQLTINSFSLLAFVVIIQSLVRLFKPDYEVVNNFVFNVLSVSVFGEVIAVIFVIVKSLWDDSEYLKKIN